MVRLAFRQVHRENRLVLRSPSGAFFTFVVPLMILVALNLVYGSYTIATRSHVGYPRFYTPAMAAFAITNACYVSLLTSVTLSRDIGMLKRIRGTPLPSWMYLFGRAGSAASLGLASTAAVLLVGTSMYPVTFPWQQLPELVVSVLVGTICFCLLGLAVSAAVPAANTAIPIAYGTLLPLCFISDVFFPTDTSPHWLRTLAACLPLDPLARSIEAPFMPASYDSGPLAARLGVMATWSVLAAVAILLFFRWEPQRRGTPRGLRRWRPLPAHLGGTPASNASVGVGGPP
jgi:ABC-type multidrug transport system permease subunit